MHRNHRPVRSQVLIYVRLLRSVKIPELNKMLMRYAFISGCIYLDYYSSMANNRNALPKNIGIC